MPPSSDWIDHGLFFLPLATWPSIFLSPG